MKIKFIDIIIVLIILGVLLIQMSVPRQLSPNGVYPNLIFSVASVFLLAGNLRLASIWILIGGILLDLLSPYRFGWITISFIFGIAPLYYLTAKVLRDSSLPVVFVSIFVSSLLAEVLIEVFFETGINWVPLLCALENSLFSIPLYLIIKSYMKKTEPIKI